MFYGVQSAEARLCAKLRQVYHDVLAESANLLMYFGDTFGEKLLCYGQSTGRGANPLNTATGKCHSLTHSVTCRLTDCTVLYRGSHWLTALHATVTVPLFSRTTIYGRFNCRFSRICAKNKTHFQYPTQKGSLRLHFDIQSPITLIDLHCVQEISKPMYTLS